MPDEKITLAIFDFDGTLTEGHLWLGISHHHQEKRVKRRSLLFYLLTHLPFWVASKIGLYSEEKNRSKWGEDLSSLFKGFTVEEARNAFNWVTENYFLPLMRSDIVKRMQDHRKSGHKVMLLSGMFTDFLEVIGKKFKVDYIVGTRLEIKNGQYSGKIIKPLCFGENKTRLLNEYIQQRRLNVDYSLSSAYADSIYDTPVLRQVGHPVATYPDKDLYKLALNEKWEILGHINNAGNH